MNLAALSWRCASSSVDEITTGLRAISSARAKKAKLLTQQTLDPSRNRSEQRPGTWYYHPQRPATCKYST